MKKGIAIVGIHTGIGKTMVSAVLTEALKMDYWKPIQAGDLDHTDSMKVRSLISNHESIIHPEAFRLTRALSPHEAAQFDGVTIDIDTLSWPVTDRPLLIETAGGLMSPFNDHATVIDFVSHYRLPVVLVIQHYLGSINHSMLCLEAITDRKINILGMIVSGKPNPASMNFISRSTSVPLLAEFPHVEVNRKAILELADGFRSSLLTLLQHA